MDGVFTVGLRQIEWMVAFSQVETSQAYGIFYNWVETDQMDIFW